ncbi:MAG: hypothetical protein B7Y39_07650 [Bdellovibrio sp. 28-41-41]|nr:MAG: hypothetical protein B7Y39_07650 [Bdellovibrio sp. 28-41-41]
MCLHSQGRTVRVISRLLKKDRRALTKVIEKGIAEHPTGYVPPWVLEINWEAVRQQYGKGVPLNILDASYFAKVKCFVVEFHFYDAEAARRNWWLVIESGEVDLCIEAPEKDVDLHVSAKLKESY